MLTILGAVFGFASPFIPDVLGFFKNRQDNKHEIALLEIQGKHANDAHLHRMEATTIESIGKQNVAVYQHAAQPVGYKWVEALIGTVRPLITYAFFGLYTAVKVAQYNILTSETAVNVSQAIVQLWTAEDMAVFTTIICFWFGQRLRSKAMAGR